jgi:hypothetical protein
MHWTLFHSTLLACFTAGALCFLVPWYWGLDRDGCLAPPRATLAVLVP